jgi:hypothetical protein
MRCGRSTVTLPPAASSTTASAAPLKPLLPPPPPLLLPPLLPPFSVMAASSCSMASPEERLTSKSVVVTKLRAARHGAWNAFVRAFAMMQGCIMNMPIIILNLSINCVICVV